MLTVTVVYVDKLGKLFLKQLELSENTTLIQAIYSSDIFETLGSELDDFKAWLETTAIDAMPNHKNWLVGIFSHKKPLNHILQTGDRIEIYRPLELDAMTSRQSKVNHAKKQVARLRSMGVHTAQKNS